MKFSLLTLIIVLRFLIVCDLRANAFGSSTLSIISREGDPESIVKNVNIIHGNYSELEIDAIVEGPDPLIVYRTYNSTYEISHTNLGSWQLLPHCYLRLAVDCHKNESTKSEEESTHLLINTEHGDTLCYSSQPDGKNSRNCIRFEPTLTRCNGLVNNARGIINSRTNHKNSKAYFYPENHIVEFFPSAGGKRIYHKTSMEGYFRLSSELLPKENKIFYHYDEIGRLFFMEMKNKAENKVISWIKINYGDDIELLTSDLQRIQYHFLKPDSGDILLKEVTASRKPCISYRYEILDKKALLTSQELPEGRFVVIDYDKKTGKVKTLTESLNNDRKTNTHFEYSENVTPDGYTEVIGPENKRKIYRFNNKFQLVAVEDYLSGSLYRVHKKIWGDKEDSGNLIATYLTDDHEQVFCFKTFKYNKLGDILEEQEFGNMTGIGSKPIQFDSEGKPYPDQESHLKSYSYKEDKLFHYVEQKDVKDIILKLQYLKESNLLVSKLIIEKGDRATCIKRREFYEYNDEGSLIRMIADDDSSSDPRQLDTVKERHFIYISPKKDLPNVGIPEIIQEKYLDRKNNTEVLVSQRVNHFDEKGYIRVQDVYDSDEKYQFSIKKDFNEEGLLSSETDPAGNVITYDYDLNHNLRLETHHSEDRFYEYDYDLRNNCISTKLRGNKGEYLEITAEYDGNGNFIISTDKNGNETIYEYDDQGRVISLSYPEIVNEEGSTVKPKYAFSYDIFDNAVLITDPEQRVTSKTFTVRGQPTFIRHPDGTEELFKYDTEGTLHRRRQRDGTVKVFDYDFLGRIFNIRKYPRGDISEQRETQAISRKFDAFHVKSEMNDWLEETVYTYDLSGKLVSQSYYKEKIEFQYDSLGRVRTIMKWKTDGVYTLESKKYNILGDLLEERVEDEKGNILLKKRYEYDSAGQLKDIIGYPNNQESILTHYEYDGLGRVSEISNGSILQTKIIYDDAHINEIGQRVCKKTYQSVQGNQIEEIFDVFDRPAQISIKNSKSEVLFKKELFYTATGHKTYERYARIPQQENAEKYSIQWKYEKGDLLTSFVQGVASSNELKTIYNYNSFGDLESQVTSERTEPITYKYNGFGILQWLIFKDRNYSHKYSFNFRSNGDLRHSDTTRFLIYRGYTEGRLDYEKIEDKYKHTDVVKDYKISQTYDKDGLISSITLPDESLIKYSYQGPLIVEIARYSKDKTELYKHKITSYDQMGNILIEELPYGCGERRQTWDCLARKIGIWTPFFQDKVAEEGYDIAGRLKGREIIIDQSKTNFSYEYNDLSQLISENGIFNCSYIYDSLDNRLSKNEVVYKYNDLNQLKEAFGVIYDYDLNGNLTSNNCKGATYRFNALNQLSNFEDSKGNKISYFYDVTGRRLAKEVKTPDKKVNNYFYFYLGETELGCIDKNGTIIELRIPLDPNQPEKAPSISFEINNTIFIPIQDLQGNVGCLVDPKQRKTIESYHFSAFGEEKIYNDKSEEVTNSIVGNPWRYLSKRIDKETGLIYFGKRYYDSSLGRWISPDPTVSIDCPNLYCFVHNNPFLLTDYLGLSAEPNLSITTEFLKYFNGDYEPHCACSIHRGCRRGGDMQDALGGSLLGIKKFFFSTARALADQYGAMAMADTLEDFPLLQREAILEAAENSWIESEKSVESLIVNNVDFNPLSKQAKSYQKGTYYTLMTLGLIRGNFKNPKRFFSSPTVIEQEIRYTRSSLRLGQEMHKVYKIDQVIPGKKIKEFRLLNNQKIDFLDRINMTIYELKPNNPLGIKRGKKQLEKYVEELKKIPEFKDVEWQTVLETY